MDLISRYIQQGRFGAFVQSFIQMEYERERAKEDNENEWRLWTAYIHSESDESFNEWRKRFIRKPKKATKDNELTDDGIKSILNKLFPSQGE